MFRGRPVVAFVLASLLAACSAGEEVWPADAFVPVEVSLADSSVSDARDDVEAVGETGVDASSADAGETGPTSLWRPTGGPWASSWLSAVAVQGADWAVSTPVGFVFRSRDGGATFEPWPDERARMRASVTRGVAISGGHVVVTGEQGVFSAPVSGGAFKRLLAPWVWTSTLAVSAYGFVAATPSGAWITTTWFELENRGVLRRSLDAGATWSFVSWNGWSPFVRAEGETVFLGEANTGVLRRSLDGGATFESIDTGAPSVHDAVTTKSHLVVAQRNALRVRSLGDTTWNTLAAFSSFDPAYRSLVHDGDVVVALSPLTSFRTTNGGANWSELPGVHVDALSPGVVAAGAMVVPTARTGLRRSIDGGVTWNEFGRGLQATRIRQLVARPGAPGTLFAAERDSFQLMKSTNAGVDWTRVGPGAMTMAFSGGALLVSGGGTVLRSTDDGATFTPVLDFIGSAVPTIACSGSIVLLTSAKGFARSTDGGLTWTQHPSPILDRRLAASPTGSVFLATVYDGILRSTDGGLTWTHGTTSMDMPDDVAFGPDGTAYAMMPDGDIHRSTDGGDTWTKIHSLGPAGALPSREARLGFTPAGELLVPGVASDASGEKLLVLFRRLSDGSFARFDEGLWASEISSYAISDGTLFVGTNAGVYRLTR